MGLIHVIAGPTASGKSARAVALAGTCNGVVINCDSLQLYEGLPLLTAQPTPDDCADVPHLLYGALHPNEPCSAGRWSRMVTPVIETCFERGQTPIICGGTGFYIKALIEGLSPIPDVPDEIRAAAVETQKRLGNPQFHAALAARDGETAARLQPHDTARLVRAWEVLELTGESLTDWQKKPKTPPPAHWHFTVEKIMPAREILHTRISDRFLDMLKRGALEEAQSFTTRITSGAVREDVPLTHALGFTALQAHLAGTLSRAAAIERAIIETRQYAKRQVTWLRHQL